MRTIGRLHAGRHARPDGNAGDPWNNELRRRASSIAGLPNHLRREASGDLPYWAANATQLKNLNYGLVSTIAYFSVGAQANGTLAKTSGGAPTTGWSGWDSAAMTDVISKAHARGVKVVPTVTMMAWDHDYADFRTLLLSSPNRSRLATDIANAVKARNADGVNLDFEPMPDSLETQYTALVRRVRAELQRVGAAVSHGGGHRRSRQLERGLRARRQRRCEQPQPRLAGRRGRDHGHGTTPTGLGRHAPGAWRQSTARTSSTRAKRCRPIWRVSPRSS